MPLVQISVLETVSAPRRKAIADAVYDAMRATLGIPEGDRFITLSVHSPDQLMVDPGFMGMHRTSDFVLIHVTLRKGRTLETKQAFYKEAAQLLQERAQMHPDNIMLVLSENDFADWSFGRGIAQFAVNQPSTPPAS